MIDNNKANKVQLIGIIILIVASLVYLCDYYSYSEFEEQVVVEKTWYTQRTLRTSSSIFILKTEKYNIPIRQELNKIISEGEKIKIEKSSFFKIKKSVIYKENNFNIATIYFGKGALVYAFLISSLIALILFKVKSEWDYTALGFSIFFLLVLIFGNIFNGIDKITIFPE